MYLKKWMYGNNAALLLLLHYYENYISTAHEKHNYLEFLNTFQYHNE